MREYQKNARCRACGYRKRGGYTAFDTHCPGCGARARWAWQIWETVIERRAGFLGLRWEQSPDDEPFEINHPEMAGRFAW